MGQADKNKGSLQRAAWPIAGFSLMLIAAGVLLWMMAIVREGDSVGVFSHQATTPISGAVFAIMGGLVLSRRPRHPVAWMLSGLGVVSGIEVLNLGYLAFSSLRAPGEVIPALDLSHWLAQWIWSPRSAIPLTLFLLLFPDGTFPSPRWRLLGWAAGLMLVGSAASGAFNPGSWEGLGGVVRNPYAVESPILNALSSFTSVLSLPVWLGCMSSIVVRFRVSTGIERQQVKWMVYAVAVVIALFVLGGVLFVTIQNGRIATELASTMVNLASIAIATAATIAVLRYRLYEIDLIINRTLVYVPLTFLVVGLYVLVVGSLGFLFQVRGSLIISLAATGLVAVLFQPMRDRLQRVVNRTLYGDRDEPYSVLSQLGRRLGGASAREELLDSIVATVASTLRLPYVALTLTGDMARELTSQHGKALAEVTEFPLMYRDQLVGYLRCGQRSRNEAFSEGELKLLGDIANQVAVAVYALRLSADLQRSRERLVTAREEERRRLRRDLHDGLGPQLASLGLKIDAARNQVESDPRAAQELLGGLRWEVKDAITDIRRLVYNLRPPVLDELGLTAALRAGAVAQLSPFGAQVVIEGPERIDRLPAAVEVAAYRITQEAVTNVARHANAKRCHVRLTVDGDLTLEIRDDGTGLPHGAKPGVGMISMEERASELGGTFKIEALQGGGTCVLVQLPLSART